MLTTLKRFWSFRATSTHRVVANGAPKTSLSDSWRAQRASFREKMRRDPFERLAKV